MMTQTAASCLFIMILLSSNIHSTSEDIVENVSEGGHTIWNFVNKCLPSLKVAFGAGSCFGKTVMSTNKCSNDLKHRLNSTNFIESLWKREKFPDCCHVFKYENCMEQEILEGCKERDADDLMKIFIKWKNQSNKLTECVSVDTDDYKVLCYVYYNPFLTLFAIFISLFFLGIFFGCCYCIFRRKKKPNYIREIFQLLRKA